METLADFLIDLGTWLIAIGLTFGVFIGLLWLMSWLIGGKK